nr:hypothetical protein [Tanacetum cinerariifolium]
MENCSPEANNTIDVHTFCTYRHVCTIDTAIVARITYDKHPKSTRFKVNCHSILEEDHDLSCYGPYDKFEISNWINRLVVLYFEWLYLDT